MKGVRTVGFKVSKAYAQKLLEEFFGGPESEVVAGSEEVEEQAESVADEISDVIEEEEEEKKRKKEKKE